MSEVINLGDLQAHVVIQTPDAVHVVPVMTLRRFVSGYLSLESIDDGEDCLGLSLYVMDLVELSTWSFCGGRFWWLL